MTEQFNRYYKRFLTLQETAEYLNIGLNQVYKMSHAGQLPGKIAFGLGDKPRNVRVDKTILEKWISENMEVVTSDK